MTGIIDVSWMLSLALGEKKRVTENRPNILRYVNAPRSSDKNPNNNCKTLDAENDSPSL